MRVGGGVVAALLVLACVPTAQAAQRYASPAGAGTACTPAVPCSLRQAATTAQTDDEVIVSPGNYTVTPPIKVPDGAQNVYVHGDFAGPIPHIEASVKGDPIHFEDNGGRMTYLEIVNEAPEAFAASCIFEGIIERVHLVARGPGAIGLLQGPGCTVRDSLLQAEGDGAAALKTTDSETSEKNDALARNVTAIATGPNSIGARADYLGVGPTFTLVLMLQNTIASGASYDLYASGIGNPGRILASHSNFDTTGTDYDSGWQGNPHGEIQLDTGNQNTPPLFVDAAAGDFREAAGSPTIDAGKVQEPDMLDLAGSPRLLGPALDIGAYEFVPASTPPPPRVVGRITSLKVSPRSFQAFEAGDRAKGGEAGTMVSYRLSASAKVRFVVEHKTVGRMVKGKCRRKTRFNDYGRPCKVYLREKLTFSRHGPRGTSHFRFFGRLGPDELEPGIYRLVGTAGGATKRAPFRIVE